MGLRFLGLTCVHLVYNFVVFGFRFLYRLTCFNLPPFSFWFGLRRGLTLLSVPVCFLTCRFMTKLFEDHKSFKSLRQVCANSNALSFSLLLEQYLAVDLRSYFFRDETLILSSFSIRMISSCSPPSPLSELCFFVPPHFGTEIGVYFKYYDIT